MAKNVNFRFRSFLPGAGFDSTGAPKQGKTRVVGVINVTSYSGEGGEPCSARDLGLSNIDAINVRVADEHQGDSTGILRLVSYTKSTGHFYLYTQVAAGDRTQVAAAATETVEFDALGDSAQDVELL